MLKTLTDFSYKRNAKEAVVFYIAYLILAFILGGITGGLAGALMGENSYPLILGLGLFFGILYPTVISLLILRQKKLLNNFPFILLALLSGVLGIFGGALLGLIPAAYLTTKERSL